MLRFISIQCLFEHNILNLVFATISARMRFPIWQVHRSASVKDISTKMKELGP